MPTTPTCHSLRLPFPFAVACALLFSACDDSVLTGPLSRPPAMLAPTVVSVFATRIEIEVTNLAHYYLGYGDCRGRSIDLLTTGGWEETTLARFQGVCDLVGHSLTDFGSTATVGVQLVGTPEPGDYRIRMRFSHRDGDVEGISNTFRIE